ncbi:MAG: hypothetical protein P1U68_05735 [Verrucomicrobiales bacterium]|nr:hypothetical protein [Verrucomicrobiales bacterium]
MEVERDECSDAEDDWRQKLSCKCMVLRGANEAFVAAALDEGLKLEAGEAVARVVREISTTQPPIKNLQRKIVSFTRFDTFNGEISLMENSTTKK